MRIVMISDTHGLHDQVKVTEGDILVHAGDFCNSGKLGDLQKFAEWFKALPHKHKVFVAGNHDWAAQHFMTEGREDLLREIFYPAIYLRDSGVTLEGINFWGSPWQPEFCNWAFNLERGKELKEKWDMIPENTDVLVTHCPPAGIMDTVRPFGKYQYTVGGCYDLYDAVQRIKPKVHVFGHIHGGYGEHPGAYTKYYNASVVNERYKVRNQPLVHNL